MESLLAHCSAAFSQHGGLFAVFLLGGFTGGFTHCLTMCGPYVACERMCASKSCGVAKTITAATGLPYHLGRMTTYGILGFLVALLSKQIAYNSWWPTVASVMLGIAGILFLISCVRPLINSCSHHEKSSHLSYLRGVLLGFMPCGLLYAALMMAATLANPFSGMVAMLLFALGTMPALVLVSGSFELLSRKWQRIFQNIGCVVMAFNGFSLLVMATRIMR